MFYAFFWVTPRRLKFICRHFGTHCLFHLHRPTKMEQSVPKRRHINFRRRSIAQKKVYNVYVVTNLLAYLAIITCMPLHFCVRWRSNANHVTDIRQVCCCFCLMEVCVFAYSGVVRQQQDRQCTYKHSIDSRSRDHF